MFLQTLCFEKNFASSAVSVCLKCKKATFEKFIKNARGCKKQRRKAFPFQEESYVKRLLSDWGQRLPLVMRMPRSVSIQISPPLGAETTYWIAIPTKLSMGLLFLLYSQILSTFPSLVKMSAAASFALQATNCMTSWHVSCRICNELSLHMLFLWKVSDIVYS